MKSYQFKIEMKSVGIGVVTAKNEKDARKKIKNLDWDDIYDTVDEEYGEAYDVEYDGEAED